jgi:hypothetical protein
MLWQYTKQPAAKKFSLCPTRFFRWGCHPARWRSTLTCATVDRKTYQCCVLPKLEKKEMKPLSPESLGTFLEEVRRSGVFELYYIDLATGLR